MLEHWLQVCQVKITFTLLPTNCFVSATMNSIKCLVNWTLLTICICSKNYQPHLKKENDDSSPQFRTRNYDYNSSHSKGRRTVIAGTSPSPSGFPFSFFEQASVPLLLSWVQNPLQWGRKNVGSTQTKKPPGQKSLVVNGVVVGAGDHTWSSIWIPINNISSLVVGPSVGKTTVL